MKIYFKYYSSIIISIFLFCCFVSCNMKTDNNTNNTYQIQQSTNVTYKIIEMQSYGGRYQVVNIKYVPCNDTNNVIFACIPMRYARFYGMTGNTFYINKSSHRIRWVDSYGNLICSCPTYYNSNY